jgi:SAM-dependent methyltransferase
MRTAANSPRIRIPRSHESFWPRPPDLRLVEEVAERIRASQAVPSWYDYYVLNHRLRIALDLELVESWLPADAPIVDLGSSPLLLVGALKSRGYDITGVDIDPSRFAGAAKALGLNLIKCNFELDALPYPDQALSGVILNEVFEHLRMDLIQTFEEIRRVMRPGARLLLSTPNGASLSTLRNLLLFNRGQDTSVYDDYRSLQETGHMGHVREYTVTDVVEFLTSMGFVCTAVVYRGRYPTNMQQLVARVCPRLRPHFTVVAQRQG